MAKSNAITPRKERAVLQRKLLERILEAHPSIRDCYGKSYGDGPDDWNGGFTCLVWKFARGEGETSFAPRQIPGQNSIDECLAHVSNPPTGPAGLKDDEFQALKSRGALGIRLPEGCLIIDGDVGHKEGVDGRETLKRLEKALGAPLTPSIQTPSGGVHIYLVNLSNEAWDRLFPMIQSEGVDLFGKHDPKDPKADSNGWVGSGVDVLGHTRMGYMGFSVRPVLVGDPNDPKAKVEWREYKPLNGDGYFPVELTDDQEDRFLEIVEAAYKRKQKAPGAKPKRKGNSARKGQGFTKTPPVPTKPISDGRDPVFLREAIITEAMPEGEARDKRREAVYKYAALCLDGNGNPFSEKRLDEKFKYARKYLINKFTPEGAAELVELLPDFGSGDKESTAFPGNVEGAAMRFLHFHRDRIVLVRDEGNRAHFRYYHAGVWDPCETGKPDKQHADGDMANRVQQHEAYVVKAYDEAVSEPEDMIGDGWKEAVARPGFGNAVWMYLHGYLKAEREAGNRLVDEIPADRLSANVNYMVFSNGAVCFDDAEALISFDSEECRKLYSTVKCPTKYVPGAKHKDADKICAGKLELLVARSYEMMTGNVRRINLVRGESGAGKSALIGAFHRTFPPYSLPTDFKFAMKGYGSGGGDSHTASKVKLYSKYCRGAWADDVIKTLDAQGNPTLQIAMLTGLSGQSAPVEARALNEGSRDYESHVTFGMAVESFGFLGVGEDKGLEKRIWLLEAEPFDPSNDLNETDASVVTRRPEFKTAFAYKVAKICELVRRREIEAVANGERKEIGTQRGLEEAGHPNVETNRRRIQAQIAEELGALEQEVATRCEFVPTPDAWLCLDGLYQKRSSIILVPGVSHAWKFTPHKERLGKLKRQVERMIGDPKIKFVRRGKGNPVCVEGYFLEADRSDPPEGLYREDDDSEEEATTRKRKRSKRRFTGNGKSKPDDDVNQGVYN